MIYKNVLFCIAESVAYEWGPRPGLINFYYGKNNQPDTRVDALSLGFITPQENAVLLRVSSGSANDYLELEIVSMKVFQSHDFLIKSDFFRLMVAYLWPTT